MTQRHEYENNIPKSILILGSGVFGLSALNEFLQRKAYADTKFTIISPGFPDWNQSSSGGVTHRGLWPSEPGHTSSYDTTRIIRADYAKSKYTELGHERIRRSPLYHKTLMVVPPRPSAFQPWVRSYTWLGIHNLTLGNFVLVH